jgi:hypothetical protein
MASQIRIPLVGGAYEGRTPAIDTQQMINYYVEGDATDARGARYAVPTPGITLYGSFGSGAARGIYEFPGYGLLAVIGSTLYLITGPSSSTALGNLATSSGRVEFVDNGYANGQQVMMIDSAGNGYVLMVNMPITTASWAANYATYTTSSAPGGVLSGMSATAYITVTGVTPTGYNVGATAVVNYPAAQEYKIAMGSNPGSYASGGTMTYLLWLNNTNNGWPSGGGGTLTWQDGYGIFNQLGTGVLWWTNAYDFTVINGLNFATAEGNPDNLTSVLSDAVRVYLFGVKTTEVWYDQGVLNEAFARLPGAIYFKGCAAQYSPAVLDNSIVFLATDANGKAQVMQVRGTQAPVAISTATIEYWFNQYTTISDAYAFAYMDQGHIFYVLTFPTAGVTWVWDATTEQWHQRSTNSGQWLPFAYTYDSGSSTHYIVDGSTNKIYYLDRTSNTDNGVTITRTIVSPYIIEMHERTFGNGVELMTNAGIGSGPTSGTITLSWSKNNAQTFTGSTTFTMTNSPTQRMYFRRLGWARQWIFKVTTTTNVIIFDLLATPMQIARIPAFPSTESG